MRLPSGFRNLELMSVKKTCFPSCSFAMSLFASSHLRRLGSFGLDPRGKIASNVIRVRKILAQLLSTAPGLGVVGAHVFAAYICDPTRFDTPAGLIRYCQLGIRDRSSDDKPLGYEQLDRHGHGI